MSAMPADARALPVCAWSRADVDAYDRERVSLDNLKAGVPSDTEMLLAVAGA